MGIKKYTEEHIQFVAELVTREHRPMKVTPATQKMAKHFKMDYHETMGRRFRQIMRERGYTNNLKRIEDSKEFQQAAKKKFDKRKKVFFVTWGQNKTAIHEKFVKNMLAYAKERKAGVHVIAGRYKNPTSLDSNDRIKFEEVIFKNSQWDERILPYLDANRHNIHPLLQILSDVKVQPTASTPLSGFNGITGLESCIIGHPRVHLKSLPVLDAYPNKLLLTTGACTVENYTDTKAGKKGEFHHQLGFVVIELDGKHFHVRQVTAADDGSFYDLKYFVKNGKVKRNKKGIEALILGDIHDMDTDPIAMEASEELMEIFRPNHTLVHDLYDGKRINPHTRKKDPYAIIRQEESGVTLQDEIDSMLAWCDRYKEHNLVIVRGNHDIFFDRFLAEDWRKLPDKLLYLKYASILAQGEAPKGVIPYIIDKRFQGEVRTLGIDDSYSVLGWELGVHGHRGAHGSIGGPTQFKNLNVKNVTGHTHVPTRIDGHLSAGTLTYLKLDYNEGMSAWMQSNVVIYPNGKAQHLHLMNGRFTTLRLN